MNHCPGLLILGFGGHARSVADVAIAASITRLLFIDENAREAEEFLGFPVQRGFSGSLPEGWQCLPAAGDNRRRQMQVEQARAAGWPLATLVSPFATCGAGATVAAGCFVGHHAHIGPMARIDEGCIVNSGALVEHDCVVGAFTHVSVNAVLAGRSRLGRRVFLGAGATVVDGVTLVDDVQVGAGGVVTDSIEIPGIYVGVPARALDESRWRQK